jgi:hypothetical protein
MENETLDNLKSISSRLKILEKRRSKLDSEIYNLREKLVVTCIHDRQEKTSKYYEGGYLNTGHIDYKICCKTCGKVIKEWSEDTGHYA